MTKFQTPYDLTGKRVYVAGHGGMVGSALVRRLSSENIGQLLTATRDQLDLTNQAAVNRWMAANKPDTVIIAAAKVGGIHANDTFPAEFLYENLMIQANIIHASHKADVEKLLFLGSSCIYPKYAEQPITEEALLSGPLEPTNEWYAIAKIAGIKLCQSYRKQYGCDYVSAMPTNLYGPGDNYHETHSHVIPGLIRKANYAIRFGYSSVEVWGTGSVRREFMHADDCADALVHILTHYSEDEHINVGTGEDISIQELARKIVTIAGFEGVLVNNTNQPDGTPRKLMSNTKLNSIGWKPSISLDHGLKQAYDWYALNHASARER